MADDKTRILFLCTGNSARSILAEAIANELYGDELQASSAGSQPKGEPNPLAIATLERHGLPTAGLRSKSWDEFRDEPFDLVVTLCDSAAKEHCPIFPGEGAKTHWGLPDPPASDNPDQTFDEVFDAIMDALKTFTAAPDYDLPARAEIVRRRVADRFPNT